MKNIKIKALSKEKKGDLNSLRKNYQNFHGVLYSNPSFDIEEEFDFTLGSCIIMGTIAGVLLYFQSDTRNYLFFIIVLLVLITRNIYIYRSINPDFEVEPFIFVNPYHFVRVNAIAYLHHKMIDVDDIRDEGDKLTFVFGRHEHVLKFKSIQDAKDFLQGFNEKQTLQENAEYEGQDVFLQQMQEIGV